MRTRWHSGTEMMNRMGLASRIRRGRKTWWRRGIRWGIGIQSGKKIRVQIVGDSNLVVNWDEKDVASWQSKNQSGCAKDAGICWTKTDIRPVAGCLGLFRHICWDWTEKADPLTHEARQKGATWNSFTMKKGSKVESVRACVDGGVSKQERR